MTTDINSENFAQLAEDLPDGQPFYMVNLLRFRDAAAYSDSVTPAGRTGQEAYFNGYLPAFSAVAKDLDLESIRPIFAGMVTGIVAGSADELWHATAIVAYPDFAAFRRIVESDAYQLSADPHRRAALADWRLIAATKLDMPG
ncbi:DUF1330 domain-containing protein [Sphingomonas sp. MMS24-J13]|uniref:DUF1330 domain-containing protein n=1 Tax=Sphingomonas sp. MMS24-J13 TaxID=3238686 RepID=UPI00384C0567